MSKGKKKKRKHQVRAVNPGQPPNVTSTEKTWYDQPTKSESIRKLKSRLLR
jgi:hypothetical protein